MHDGVNQFTTRNTLSYNYTKAFETVGVRELYKQCNRSNEYTLLRITYAYNS